jgi:hypothetical protein
MPCTNTTGFCGAGAKGSANRGVRVSPCVCVRLCLCLSVLLRLLRCCVSEVASWRLHASTDTHTHAHGAHESTKQLDVCVRVCANRRARVCAVLWLLQRQEHFKGSAGSQLGGRQPGRLQAKVQVCVCGGGGGRVGRCLQHGPCASTRGAPRGACCHLPAHTRATLLCCPGNTRSCYNYGSAPEIGITSSAATTHITKWRTIGRISRETA